MFCWQISPHHIWKIVLVAMVMVKCVSMAMSLQVAADGKSMRIDGPPKEIKEQEMLKRGNSDDVIIKGRRKRSPFNGREGDGHKGSRPAPNPGGSNNRATPSTTRKIQTRRQDIPVTTQHSIPVTTQESTTGTSQYIGNVEKTTLYNAVIATTANKNQSGPNKSGSSENLELVTSNNGGNTNKSSHRSSTSEKNTFSYSLDNKSTTEIQNSTNPYITTVSENPDATSSFDNSINDNTIAQLQNANPVSGTIQYSQTVDTVTDDDKSLRSNTTSGAFESITTVQYIPADNSDNDTDVTTASSEMTRANQLTHTNESGIMISDDNNSTSTEAVKTADGFITRPEIVVTKQVGETSGTTSDGSGDVSGDELLATSSKVTYTTAQPTSFSQCPSCEEMRSMMDEMEAMKKKYNEVIQMLTLLNDTLEEKTGRLQHDVATNSDAIGQMHENMTSQINDVRDDMGSSLSTMENSVLDRIDNITHNQQKKPPNMQVDNTTTTDNSGVPDLSGCIDMTINNHTTVNDSYTYTDWCPHGLDTNQESKVTNVYCSTYGGTQTSVEQRHSGEIIQYRCVCTGTLFSQNELRYCQIHLWLCHK